MPDGHRTIGTHSSGFARLFAARGWPDIFVATERGIFSHGGHGGHGGFFGLTDRTQKANGQTAAAWVRYSLLPTPSVESKSSLQQKGESSPTEATEGTEDFWVNRSDAKGQWTDRRRLRALSPLLTTKLGVQVFVATERGIFSHGGYGGHGGFFGLSD